MPLLSSSVATIRLFNHMNFDRVKKCQLLKEIYGAGFKKLTGCHTSSWRASRSAHKLGKLENISNANDETIRYENDDGPRTLHSADATTAAAPCSFPFCSSVSPP